MTTHSRLLLGLLIYSLCVTMSTAERKVLFPPEELVVTTQGGNSRRSMSNGNTLPLVSQPYGQTYWAPKTDDGDGSWWFHSSDYQFYGIRATHQPSPWIGDYGYATFTAALGTMYAWSGYNPHWSSFAPYYFNASLEVYCTAQGCLTLEVTATTHCAVIRLRFPPYDPNATFPQTRYAMVDLDGVTVQQVGPSTMHYIATQNQGGGRVPSDFGMNYVVQSSVPFSGAPQQSKVGGKTFSTMQFDNSVTEVTLWVGGSLISYDQASLNLQRQVQGLSFDTVMASSKQVWNRHLSRVEVLSVGNYEDPDTMLRTFYSCLYRASLFPRSLAEVDASNKTVHYSPYFPTGGVFPGELATDSGFWDAYRALYPWLNVAYPERAGTQISGWLNAYQEGGWVPQWSSPGYRGSMVGTMSDVTIADAIVKGIAGFDVNVAYQAIRKDAFVDGGGVSQGRAGLADYIRLGYVPTAATNAVSETVSRSLNYMQADFAISQAAKILNQTADAAILAARSQNYSRLFDASINFFRGKDASGTWFSPFDPAAWDDRLFTEAGGWQYRFYVPWDVKGLQQLYKGNLCQYFNDTLHAVPQFRPSPNQGEIHEETEMASHAFGMYEHNNQPVHHMLYVAIASQCPDQLAQRTIRRVLMELYSPKGFAGDEDNGEMAAWYLLSSLGIYSVNPGSTDMILGSPLFEHVRVNLNSGPLDIVAQGNGAGTPAVSSATWNGGPQTIQSIDYQTLMKGGTLAFTMMP